MTSDSVKHHEKRASNMRAEAQADQDAKSETEVNRATHDKGREERAREHEIQFLEDQAGIVREGETREMLLDRIRKMREVKEEEPKPIARTPELQEQFNREIEAGRAAVARAEAEQNKYRDIRYKQEEEERQRRNEPELVPVHHPNPSQDQQYPATAATLGKRK
jgi:hypothetical protein